MAQLVVRNLEDDVKLRLQRRARRNKRSTEEEVRTILRDAVKTEAVQHERLGSRIKALLGGGGLDEDIVELRGQPARPARFRK